jgi:hypothetical protein
MSSIVIGAVMAVFFVWLAFVTYLLLQTRNHYDNLTRDTGKKSLSAILDVLTGELQLAKKDIVKLTEQCDRIEKDGSLHIQKIGLLRFNPFKDTGGDQSFILSLVNAHDTGVVISGLYSRSGTRWYAKRVVDGQGYEHELSEDEKKAIQLAKAIGKNNGK